jgi:gluconolactonase
MRIAADGSQRFIGQRSDARFAAAASRQRRAFEAKFTQGTLPNGLAFAANGDILVSNFGTDRLEVMTRDGDTRTLYDRIDGQPIGKVNFVLRDSRNRIWLTVSTRVNPWTAAPPAGARRLRRGGRRRGLRVVADGFYFTNECGWTRASSGSTSSRPPARGSRACGWTSRPLPACGWSTARSSALRTWAATPTASPSTRFGNLWCTLVMVDQLIALTPQGDKLLLLDDGDPEASANLLWRMAAGTVTHRGHAACARGTSRRGWPASPSAGPTCAPSTWAACWAHASRISAHRWPGLPMVHW